MRSAPSVIYPVLRSDRAGVLMAGAWGLGALPVSAWLLQVAAPMWLAMAVVAGTLAAGVLCARHWWKAPADQLAWDGQSWSTLMVFDANLAVSVDLQRLMVLRLRTASGRAQWLVVDSAALPSAWHTLRCAVTGSRPERAA